MKDDLITRLLHDVAQLYHLRGLQYELQLQTIISRAQTMQAGIESDDALVISPNDEKVIMRSYEVVKEVHDKTYAMTQQERYAELRKAGVPSALAKSTMLDKLQDKIKLYKDCIEFDPHRAIVTVKLMKDVRLPYSVNHISQDSKFYLTHSTIEVRND